MGTYRHISSVANQCVFVGDFSLLRVCGLDKKLQGAGNKGNGKSLGGFAGPKGRSGLKCARGMGDTRIGVLRYAQDDGKYKQRQPQEQATTTTRTNNGKSRSPFGEDKTKKQRQRRKRGLAAAQRTMELSAASAEMTLLRGGTWTMTS